MDGDGDGDEGVDSDFGSLECLVAGEEVEVEELMKEILRILE